MRKELPAVQKAYDLAKDVLPRIGKFPKNNKISLGERINQNVLEILELLINASYTKNKLTLLHDANLHLERLRFLLRLSTELGAISNKGYIHLIKIVDDLGRQVGGWIKKLIPTEHKFRKTGR